MHLPIITPLASRLVFFINSVSKSLASGKSFDYISTCQYDFSPDVVIERWSNLGWPPCLRHYFWQGRLECDGNQSFFQHREGRGKPQGGGHRLALCKDLAGEPLQVSYLRSNNKCQAFWLEYCCSLDCRSGAHLNLFFLGFWKEEARSWWPPTSKRNFLKSKSLLMISANKANK